MKQKLVMVLTYTGVEGLTACYAATDMKTGTTATSGDQTAMKVILCLWSSHCRLSNSDHDYDVGTATSDHKTSSYNVAYTVSDELSVSYGV